MTQTPLQEAIQKLESLKEEIKNSHIPHDQKVWKRMGVDASIDCLKLLLRKEKMFVAKAFDAGVKYMSEDNALGVTTFINQLYPEK